MHFIIAQTQGYRPNGAIVAGAAVYTEKYPLLTEGMKMRVE